MRKGHVEPSRPRAVTMSTGTSNLPRPVIFLAFANEQEGRRHLRDLPEEQQRLREALQQAVDRGLCELEVGTNASLDEVEKVFIRHGRSVAISHFACNATVKRAGLETDRA
jgi:hypothetical protein